MTKTRFPQFIKLLENPILFPIPYGRKGAKGKDAVGWPDFQPGYNGFSLDGKMNVALVLKDLTCLDLESITAFDEYSGGTYPERAIVNRSPNGIHFIWHGKSTPARYVNETGNLVCEIRSERQYILIPPSEVVYPDETIHPYRFLQLPDELANVPEDLKERIPKTWKLEEKKTKTTTDNEASRGELRGDGLYTLVRKNVPADEVLPVDRKGPAYQLIRCIFPEKHKKGDRLPSMMVNVRDGVYHCFGCEEVGSVIDAHAKLNGLSVRDSAIQLAKAHNLGRWKY